MKNLLFSLLINMAIFSFLPIVHVFFHRPASELEPIQVDLIKLETQKPQLKQRPKPREIHKQAKRKSHPLLKFKRRISFELDPNALASEVDLIAPMVTYDLDEVDEFPELIKYIEPDYPHDAVTRGIEGVVKLKILITTEGKVSMIKVLDNGGFYEFGIAAKRVVKRWRFEPAKIMGMSVSVWCEQSVRFELSNQEGRKI